MDFERLSDNIISIINEMLKNQSLVNYIGYNGNDPDSQTINPATIAPNGVQQKIFPNPFNANYVGDVRSQVHVYYPQFTFINNGHANKVMLAVDICVHKDIWLMKNGSKKLVRPYQIAKLIIETLGNRHIPSVGKLHFSNGEHSIINEEFEAIRLFASFTEF